MESLVITLREGMEIALVVGLILAYLNRTGRLALRRYVYLGVLLAALASLAGAAAFGLLGLDVKNEALEGTLLAVAAALVLTLILWMRRASRGMKQYVEAQLAALTRQAERRQGWGLLGFTFFMVFREGVEIVLFLAALSLATGGWLQFLGGAAGLGLAALLGVLFFQGSIHIDLRRFFSITSLVLIVLVVQLLAGSVHEFAEAGLLPEALGELAVIRFLSRDSTAVAVLIVLVLLPALAMLPNLRRPSLGAGRSAG